MISMVAQLHGVHSRWKKGFMGSGSYLLRNQAMIVWDSDRLWCSINQSALNMAL